MELIAVKDKLPDCWSKHNRNYASGYLIGFTKYEEFEIVQLWSVKQEDGSYKNEW